jgi:alkylated DNA repair dioxygenase AlkB
MASNFDLFEVAPGTAAPSSAVPPGFRYTRDIVTPDEEATLAAEIAQLELKPFEFHGYLGLRRIHPFGYRYDYSHGKVASAEPIPDFLQPLRRKVADFAGRNPDEFRQVLVTQYAPGAPIGWHKDKPQFGIVVGVSLVSPCTFRLRRRRSDGKWDRSSITLEPRSAYLMSGESRELWEHSIQPMTTLRYSLTFRTLADGFLTSL